jgi:hypothetical protein
LNEISKYPFGSGLEFNSIDFIKLNLNSIEFIITWGEGGEKWDVN